MFKNMDAYQIENNFYFQTPPQRMAKLLAHYELYKKILPLKGEIIEGGVFKGTSLIRFAKLRTILENSFSRKIFAFDVFGNFPNTNLDLDQNLKNKFIEESKPSDKEISIEEIKNKLTNLNLFENIELVKGDITQTIPEFTEKNPEIKIALLHIDVDLFEATETLLKYLWPRVVKGGIVILDDYGYFAGANKAIEDFFPEVQIKKIRFSHTPSYIIK